MARVSAQSQIPWLQTPFLPFECPYDLGRVISSLISVSSDTKWVYTYSIGLCIAQKGLLSGCWGWTTWGKLPRLGSWLQGSPERWLKQVILQSLSYPPAQWGKLCTDPSDQWEYWVCHRWMSVPCPNSQVRILTPRRMVLGGAALGRIFSPDSRALLSGISALIKEAQRVP